MYKKLELLWVVPLVLANIFVGYYGSKLFNEISKPTIYCCYVDDTFSLFHKETEFQKFLNCLKFHPSLKFTNEIETNNSLPFSMYLLPNLMINLSLQSIESPLYIHWNSFGSKQHKTNLIDTLTHQALKICSKSTLKHELNNICSILVQNGYPEFLIDLRISKKLLRFQQSNKEGPKKCPVYLKLPWIGKNSLKFEKIKLSINNCFGAIQP